jgi:hypothetical protein
MFRVVLSLWVIGCVGLLGPLAGAGDKLPLRLLYLGNDPLRTAAFEQFLEGHFVGVVTRSHDAVDDQVLESIDVVLLDWSQREAYSSRSSSPSSNSDRFAVNGDSPLGVRDDWGKPTVLLGSAGHLLAGFWQIAGGSG